MGRFDEIKKYLQDQYERECAGETAWCDLETAGELREMVEQLQAQVDASAGLSCPNPDCNNAGFTSKQDGWGRWYQCQCEFCYTVKDSVFNRAAAIKGDGDE